MLNVCSIIKEEEMSSPIFQGNTKVYLQGLKALKTLHHEPANKISFVIGSTKSSIFVEDNRKSTITTVDQILSGNTAVDFADSFNLPAHVEINEFETGFHIKMTESSSQENQPTLWLGVIRNNQMPVHNVSWEVLKPVGKTAVAFAAIIND
jgi:hypothetical protein